MRVILAQPRGFCAGVVRAISIVERALEKYEAPVFVRHEIVHNKHVVDTLKKHPLFNSSLDEAADEIVLKEYFHIGIAVDTERGLVVPVVRDCDEKSMLTWYDRFKSTAGVARRRGCCPRP